jgi:CRP-like cAMP-binding protein
VDHQILQAKSELLRRMSADDFARLKPHLESVFLELRAPLETAGQKIEFVYFLESGLASVVRRIRQRPKPKSGSSDLKA